MVVLDKRSKQRVKRSLVRLTRGKAEKFMKIFACLCPAASSHSMLCFDAFARDRDLPLGSNLAGCFFLALRAKDAGVISVDTVTSVIQG